MPAPARAIVPIVSALACAILPACTRPSSDAPRQGASAGETISLSGSDTMVLLGQRWAEEYMRANPSVSLHVSGGGSGTGIAALIQGSADICQASRAMTDREQDDLEAKRGKPAVQTKVALDAVAIYVNAKNPLRDLSLPRLAAVYEGKITRWEGLGGAAHAVVVYGRENNSGTYGYFKEHVLGGVDFAAGTQELAGTAAVASAVKADEFGIGYGGIAYGEGVRALAIRRDEGAPAVTPSLEAAQRGTYPLTRYLYFYTAGPPSPVMQRFIAWVTGPEGQKMVSDVGYYPLPKES
jgi:phosphate transport system substrate-binding protein